jgi:excisionase family DNA binding protein
VNDDIPKDLVSPTRAARSLGIHATVVWRWVRTGRVRSWKLPGQGTRVSRREVLAVPKR